MTIPTFIEKAIEGGWQPEELLEADWQLKEVKNSTAYFSVNSSKATLEAALAIILLDPEAWKAVGKVEGWKENPAYNANAGSWLYYMHRMIDALAEGKSIEQYLETL